MTIPVVLSPTAIVSYSHTEDGWSEEQTRERRDLVQRFVYALRAVGGVDADADIFHMNEDWSRWGPAQVAASNYVLVIASPAWKSAWVGDGDPLRNKGVRAEADAVRSIEQSGRPELQRRVRLINLDGSGGDDVPVGMHGIARYRLSGFSLEDLTPLLRDLTGQPEFVKPPLGSVPVFPPTMTAHTSAPALGPEHEPSSGDGYRAAGQDTTEADRPVRIDELKAQLAALPEPQPGEGPHLPWVRTRQQIEGRLWVELAELASRPSLRSTGAGDMPTVDWTPATNVTIRWTEQQEPELHHGSTSLAVHVVPVSLPPLSQRILSSLDDAITRVVREVGVIDDTAGINHSHAAGDLVLQADTVRLHMGESQASGFVALRTGPSGQVSVWYSLPRDTLGSVLDEQRIRHDIQSALGLAAAVLAQTYGDRLDQVAVAAELVNTTMLTTGTFENLGRRTNASMPGAFRKPPRMAPDESIDARHLKPGGSWSVAATVAQILVREWAN